MNTTRIQNAIDAHIALTAAEVTDPTVIYAETARLRTQAHQSLKGMTRTQIKTVMDAVRAA